MTLYGQGMTAVAALLLLAGCEEAAFGDGEGAEAGSTELQPEQAVQDGGEGAGGASAEPKFVAGEASPDDADGCESHPAVSRYPGTVLAWCETENYREFRVPLDKVTGYRQIGEWEDTAGRLTRNFFRYEGEDRTHGEVYLNYLEALKAAGFEILGNGLFPTRNVKGDIGGRNWQGIYYTTNKWGKGGGVNTLAAGTSSSGGSGSVVARKRRADGPMYVVVNIEQHSKDEIGVLVDVLEAKEAETGLVVANADAMGKDLEEYGRTVIEGLMFDTDKTTLKPESKPALDETAKLLKSMSGKSFYVVGHTDAEGTYDYNMRLSSGRAATVRRVLVEDYGIAEGRLKAVGVGPVSPVFTNSSDTGKSKNRRVELVEQ